jgi:putative alpha-1,2-mannosidase
VLQARIGISFVSVANARANLAADLAFNSPVFPTAVMHLPSGNQITINAPGASETTFYVQSQKINGRASTRLFLPASALTTGATIEDALGPSPSSWGSGPADAPLPYDS